MPLRTCRVAACLLIAGGGASFAFELIEQSVFSRGGAGSLSYALSAIFFVLNVLSLALQFMHSTLTRRFAVARLVIGLNVVSLLVAVLVRERLSSQSFWEIVAGLPLLTSYAYWARMAMAPPGAGEALRPEKELKECHWASQLGIWVVLLFEFVQFNSLSFNPELDVWTEMPSFTAFFSISFLLFEEEAPRNGTNASTPSDPWAIFLDEHQWGTPEAMKNLFWLSVVLGAGWALFALCALVFSRLAARRRERTVLGEAELDANYTTELPLLLAVLWIGATAHGALAQHRGLLRRCRALGWRAAWDASAARPAPLALLLLLLLLLGVGPALLGLAALTLGLLLAVAAAALFGLCVCAAFGTISLLHFPLMTQMLAVLRCDYLEGGEAGTMHRIPSQPCGEGEHLWFVLAAVLAVLVIYPLMLVFERRRQCAAEISHHVRFTSCMLIGKLLLSAVSTLLPITSPVLYVLVCSSLLLCFLHFNNDREQDAQPACCNVRTVRLMRSCVLCSALWSCAATLATVVLPLPQAAALGLLVALWLLTAAYFSVLVRYPQHEPRYLAQTAHIAIAPPPPPLPPPPPPPGVAASPHAAAAAAAATPGGPKSPLGSPFGSPARGPDHAAAAGASGRAAARRAGAAAVETPPRAEVAAADGDGCRVVWLGPNVRSRPRVGFFEHNDGFEREEAREGGGAARRCEQLLPVVMTADAAEADAADGGVGPRAPLGLAPCDVIVAINGEAGLGAEQAAERLGAPGRLELRLRPARLRAAGCKRGPCAAQLREMRVKHIAQSLLLYPQDAALQAAGCAELRRRLRAAEPQALLELLREVEQSAVLPVAINALEVHRAQTSVHVEAARLLATLAELSGRLRANMVAAGVLPAACAALGSRKLGARVEVVGGVCELCRVLVSRPRALPGARRALCEALAATGALRLALAALCAHAAHEAVAASCCALLAAYHDVFEDAAADPTPAPLRAALADGATLAALQRVQQLHAHNTAVGLATKWAVGLGRAEQARREQEEAAQREAWAAEDVEAQGGERSPLSPTGVNRRTPARAAKKAFRAAARRLSAPPSQHHI